MEIIEVDNSEVICKMKVNKHIVPADDMWAIRGEGKKRVSRIFSKKTDALRHAFSGMKRNSCVYVHGKNGRITDVRCLY